MMTTKVRIKALRLFEKLEINSTYADKIGISHTMKKAKPDISNTKKGVIENEVKT